MKYRGDFSEDAIVRVKFTTVDGNGSPVAPSAAFEASDFVIFKDSETSPRATMDGVTVTSPHASVVGRHLIVINTSVDTGDVGFWTAGSDYFVEVSSSKTVDGQSQTGIEVCSFSIENRHSISVGSGVGSPSTPYVVRSNSDARPIFFTFPTGGLVDGDFTKSRRINGGTNAGVSGAISFLYAMDGKQWYSLSYDATDRPANNAEGVVQYSFEAFGKIVVVNLSVVAREWESQQVTDTLGMLETVFTNTQT